MASETTPLLPATNNAEDNFPPILSAAQRLPPEPSFLDFENLYPHSFGRAHPLRAIAFRLLLVLHLLVVENKEDVSSRRSNTIHTFQTCQDHHRRREKLRGIASTILNQIPDAIADAGQLGATEGVPKDISIEHILLGVFPRDPLARETLRVIDLLPHPAIPTEVLSHPIINLSLVRLWKYGKASLEHQSSESSLRTILRVYDAASAPRTVHAVHMAAHLSYLVFLAHLILYPSPRPILVETPGGPTGLREPIIAIYSISNIAFNPLSSSTFPHICVLFSLLKSIPMSPSPGAISYSLLVYSLCSHILLVQFPSYPSLSLLLEPTRWLPLSSLYVACLLRYLLPAFVFLLPVLLASTVLLSLSLSGESVGGLGFGSSPSAPPSAFLVLFCIGCFLFLYLSISSLLLSPSPTFHTDQSWCDWERYGAGAGILGRRSLIRAILAYSSSYRPFRLAVPPPLNILSLPLVILWVLFRQLFRLM